MSAFREHHVDENSAKGQPTLRACFHFAWKRGMKGMVEGGRTRDALFLICTLKEALWEPARVIAYKGPSKRATRDHALVGSRLRKLPKSFRFTLYHLCFIFATWIDASFRYFSFYISFLLCPFSFLFYYFYSIELLCFLFSCYS